MARIDHDSFTAGGQGFYAPTVSVFMLGSGDPAPTPPVVANISPAPGTTLQPGDLISFDVTDDSGAFRRILVAAAFGALPTRELVHDGDTFAPLYAAGSSRTAVEGGFRFVLRRAGGWPAAPTLTPFAIDTRGAENA